MIIFTCSFQLAFGETLMRLPSSVESGARGVQETFIQQITRFQEEVVGRDDTSHCQVEEEAASENISDSEELSEEDLFDMLMEQAANEEDYLNHRFEDNTQEKYEEMLSKIEENACGYSNFKKLMDGSDEDENLDSQSSCSAKRIAGAIDRFNSTTSAEEKNRENISLNTVGEFDVLYKKAKDLKLNLENIIASDDLDVDERKRIYLQYMDHVVMPLRDYVVTIQAYTEKSIEWHKDVALLAPTFSRDLFSTDNEDDVEVLKNGISANGPLNLDIVERESESHVAINGANILSRDIVTLVKSKTAKNYVRSLKWMTLQMMASQIFNYNSILGDSGDVEIPRSCRSHFSANLPEKISFSYKEGQGDFLSESILKNHGLIFDENDLALREYYQDNLSKDPTMDSYSGLTPFEDYKNAIVEVEGRNISGVEAGIDDYSHYKRIMDMKSEKIKNVFYDEKRGRYSRNASGERTNIYEVNYPGKELFNKIISTPMVKEQYQLSNGEEILPYQDNLSVYLAEYMQRKGVRKIEDAVSKELEESLKKNIVKISFPPLYGASLWRQWAINQLSNFLKNQAEELDPEVRDQVIATCTAYGNTNDERWNQICPNFKGYLVYPDQFKASGEQGEDPIKSIVSSLSNSIQEYENFEEIIPLRKLQEGDLEKMWPVYEHFWNGLLNSRESLTFAKINEYQFILDQMISGNPWARLRLGYLVLLEELKEQREGFEPTYKQVLLWKQEDQNTQCFKRYTSTHLDKVNEAAKVLGLDRILSPYHGNKILSRDEKTVLWREVVDKNNTDNEYLFSTSNGSGEDYYQAIDRVNFSTLLTPESVDELMGDLPNGIDEKAQDELNILFDSDQGKVGTFFLDLYKLKGSYDEQYDYFESFSHKHGIDSEYDVALDFLNLDSTVKKSVYKSILREAAQKRKNQIEDRLKSFCEMDVNDHKKLKTMFYMTSKAQARINELAGLPAVPESVMAELEPWMSNDDKIDIGLGVGAIALGIGAAFAGGMCTFMTAGVCAPFAVGIMAAAVGSGAMQGALVFREFRHLDEANHNVAEVKSMEELGFANLGSSSNVGRHWFWATFETVSFFPLLGLIGRGANVGKRLFHISRMASKRKLSRSAFKREVARAFAEEEVRLSSALIHGTSGFDAVSTKLAGQGVDIKTINSLRETYDKVILLRKSGRITHQQMMKKLDEIFSPFGNFKNLKGTFASREVGKVVAVRSEKEINRDTVARLSEHFGGNWNHYLKIMRTFEKWSLAVATPHNPLATWRLKHLIANKDFIGKFTKELDLTLKSGGDVSKLVSENIELLTHLHMKAPMRKRSILHLFLVQGVPSRWESAFVKGIRPLGGIGDEIIVKKLFTARSRLVKESLQAMAREFVGLGIEVGEKSTYDIFKALDNLVGDRSLRASRRPNRIQYESVKKLMIQVAWRNIHAKKKSVSQLLKRDLSEAEFKRILFRPVGAKEEATAEILWDASYSDEMINVAGFPEFAHEAMKKLANYDDVDEFKDFFTVMKVLLLQRTSAKVEIF